MNPIKLVRADTGLIAAYACGKCGRLYGLNDSFAERCCDPRCKDCGEPSSPSSTMCSSCRSKNDSTAETNRAAKAKVIAEADYTGPVFLEGTANDGFSRDIEEARESWQTRHDDATLPEYAWACTSRRLCIPDAAEIIERATDDAYEGADNDMPGTEDLQKAIDAYNARVTAEAWEIDYSRRIVFERT